MAKRKNTDVFPKAECEYLFDKPSEDKKKVIPKLRSGRIAVKVINHLGRS
ncbi:MAG: hypothetical protein ACKOEM_10545 [Planctomycetia bacterium]